MSDELETAEQYAARMERMVMAPTNPESTTVRRRVIVEGISLEEAQLIERGLAEADVRAFVIVAGVLAELPSDRARRRVLAFVTDIADEGAGMEER